MVDPELRNRVYTDTTKMVNKLSPLRRGEYIRPEVVTDILRDVAIDCVDLILAIEHPQLELWKRNADSSAH